MRYRVELTVRATRDLDDLYQQIRAAESIPAARWFNGLEKAICTLEHFPFRCPVAPEAGTLNRPLRHLLYGKKPHVYRVIYEIREPTKVVYILTIRHGARERFSEPPLTTP